MQVAQIEHEMRVGSARNSDHQTVTRHLLSGGQRRIAVEDAGVNILYAGHLG